MTKLVHIPAPRTAQTATGAVKMARGGRTVAVRVPCVARRVCHIPRATYIIHKILGQPHGKRKGTVRPTYGRRGTALRHGYGVSNCYGEPRNEKSKNSAL